MIHLLRTNDAKRTACGIKANTNEALPLLLARHVQAHVDGYDPDFCRACLEACGIGIRQ